MSDVIVLLLETMCSTEILRGSRELTVADFRQQRTQHHLFMADTKRKADGELQGGANKRMNVGRDGYMVVDYSTSTV